MNTFLLLRALILAVASWLQKVAECYLEFLVSGYHMKQEITKFLFIGLKDREFPIVHLYLLKTILYKAAALYVKNRCSIVFFLMGYFFLNNFCPLK